MTSRIKRTCFRQPIQTVLCSGFLILLSFFPSLNARSEPSPSLSSIDALAKELNTPEALEKFMGKKFHYVSDRLLFHQDEYWQTPEEILARGAGDCEDYALFAEAILKRIRTDCFLWEQNQLFSRNLKRDYQLLIKFWSTSDFLMRIACRI